MKRDLFDTSIEVRSIFDKSRNHWSVEDYRRALSELSDEKMKFRFYVLDRMTVASPAFMSLSPRAGKLYIAAINAAWISERVNKRTIEKHEDTVGWYDLRPMSHPFHLPFNLCKAFNVGNSRQIRQAFDELMMFGFLEQIGVSRRNYPNTYRHVSRFVSLSWADCMVITDRIQASKTSIKSKKRGHIGTLEANPKCHIDTLEAFLEDRPIVSKMPFSGSNRCYEQVFTYH